MLDEEHAAAAGTLLSFDGLHAPDHWLAEAMHAVSGAARRGALSASEAAEGLRILLRAPVRGVALAEVLRVPFITADERLLRRLAEARIADGLTRWVGDLS